MTMGTRGLRTILRSVSASTEAHRLHNVTSQVALVTDIQVFMLVKQTAKHHSLTSPHCIYHSQYSDSPDITLVSASPSREQPTAVREESSLKQFGQLAPGSRSGSQRFIGARAPEWNAVRCKSLTKQRGKSD